MAQKTDGKYDANVSDSSVNQVSEDWFRVEDAEEESGQAQLRKEYGHERDVWQRFVVLLASIGQLLDLTPFDMPGFLTGTCLRTVSAETFH